VVVAVVVEPAEMEALTVIQLPERCMKLGGSGMWMVSMVQVRLGQGLVEMAGMAVITCKGRVGMDLQAGRKSQSQQLQLQSQSHEKALLSSSSRFTTRAASHKRSQNRARQHTPHQRTQLLLTSRPLVAKGVPDEMMEQME